ncbi:hypothetical protein XELAEV_18009888mg [Xenopus laevis]|uniref:Uncharacterized protein n=1 Tax=Xenopus laevis TaxID=8355 RepID=A0A974DTI3_XENLA|nr:hypothetical protein XELAEV_18009888mg [Xenopus laevis]
MLFLHFTLNDLSDRHMNILQPYLPFKLRPPAMAPRLPSWAYSTVGNHWSWLLLLLLLYNIFAPLQENYMLRSL